MIYCVGIRDDSDTFSAIASLAYWPAKQLASGNFTVCAPGIIDVRFDIKRANWIREIERFEFFLFVIQMLGTGIFKAPALKFAKLNAHSNQHKTFLYTFDYKGEHTR